MWQKWMILGRKNLISQTWGCKTSQVLEWISWSVAVRLNLNQWLPTFTTYQNKFHTNFLSLTFFTSTFSAAITIMIKTTVFFWKINSQHVKLTRSRFLKSKILLTASFSLVLCWSVFGCTTSSKKAKKKKNWEHTGFTKF